MEDLAEELWAINLDAEIEAEHPILTDGERCDVQLKINPQLLESRSPEEVCRTRWPEYQTEEKYRLEKRLGRLEDWAPSMRKIDAHMDLWQDDGKPIQNTRLSFLPWARQPSVIKKNVQKHKPEQIVSLAVGTDFAVVLQTDGTNLRAGGLWWFPIYRVEVEEQRHWRRVSSNHSLSPDTVPSISHYQTCYALHEKLYLVDEGHLLIIDVSAGRLLAKLDLYTAAKLNSEVRIKRLVVTLSGLAMFQLHDQGVVYLCDLSDDKLRMMKQFRRAINADIQYTAFAITPCNIQKAEILLGREDGIVERWLVHAKPEDVRAKPYYDADLNLLGNKISTDTHKTIKVKAGVPITYLYHRGRRTIICTAHNRIILEDTPKVPMFCFTENEKVRVSEVDICGDLMITLCENGALRGAPFISTISPIMNEREDQLLSIGENLEPGCQRLVVYPDMVVMLAELGKLLFMTHSPIQNNPH